MTLLKTDLLNILVVEDNPGDFLLLKESISLSGIPAGPIHLAETLEEAIEFLRHNTPPVVFLDLYLPDSHGLESFEQLKKHTLTPLLSYFQVFQTPGLHWMRSPGRR